MRSFIFLFLFVLFTLSSCQSTSKIQESEVLQTALSLDQQYPLVHLIFFKVKESADVEGLISEIKKIKSIPVLKGLEVGSFRDLDDPRAMSEYKVFMQMRFASEADYKLYQQHPLHLALKENTKVYMAGPPLTYDYKVR